MKRFTLAMIILLSAFSLAASDILVAYFSATGNTERVARYISEATGGDLYQLLPEEPYSRDDLNYRDEDSRVSREHRNPSEANEELSNAEVPNMDGYSVVFIGYPIWWGEAAWPVHDFIRSNSFEGKRVIPFATSASSGFGRSGEILCEMADGGEWDEGIRFRSRVQERDVAQWVESLDL